MSFFKAILATVALLLSFQAISQKIDYFRPYSKDGLYMFDTPLRDTSEFTGLKVRVGGNFTQQFQSLDHSNEAILDPNGDGQNENQLIGLKPGFNLATANLNVDVQLEKGVRLHLITYLSSRHHPESWVKGGYIQFDELPFLNSPMLDQLMEFVTIRIGHMEVNYGDAHLRRTDNGNAIWNPFVGNYIMDAFNTEIGGEVYFRTPGGFISMLSLTGGEIRGDVTEVAPPFNDADEILKRSPSIIGKLGFDKQVNEDFRLRITGSVYHTASSSRNFLYFGDRGGSRYYLVMENTEASVSGDFRSGRFQPGFMDKVTSLMGNVFLKYGGLEFFGTIENSDGRMNFETEDRNANQFAGEVIYRFGKNENAYLGARYNRVGAEMLGSGQEIDINRVQLAAGWFVTKNILLKGEYVRQQYNDFSETSIFHEGEFDGFMLEATVGF